MKRSASAQWKGSLKEGRGVFDVESGNIPQQAYTWSTRFGDAKGTNPEELVAAAHASCFSMALSAELGKASITPESIDTKAVLTMEKTDAGMTVTGIHLDVRAKIPGNDAGAFEKAAQAAKSGCPISRLLAPGAKITMDAKLA